MTGSRIQTHASHIHVTFESVRQEKGCYILISKGKYIEFKMSLLTSGNQAMELA